MRTLILVTIAALAVPAAARADCATDADRLAERYGLSAQLPQSDRPSQPGETPATTESRGLPPEALSRSGGVIAPPEEGRGRVIEPPAADRSMPTAPEVRPAPAPGDTQRRAAKTAQVQSLVTAARAAADRGNEAECARRLEEARALGDPGG
jgi:hypothetical protein